MKQKLPILTCFLLLIGLVLCSSFVLIDLQESDSPITLKAIDWISDHQLLTALAVYESTGMLSSKFRGFVHGTVVFLRSLSKILKGKPAKATNQ